MWPNPHITERILNGKLYFLCSVGNSKRKNYWQFCPNKYNVIMDIWHNFVSLNMSIRLFEVIEISIRRSLRKKCPYSEFFWSLFSHIRTDYGEILRISPYSVLMRENTDQKNSVFGHFSCSALDDCLVLAHIRNRTNFNEQQ